MRVLAQMVKSTPKNPKRGKSACKVASVLRIYFSKEKRRQFFVCIICFKSHRLPLKKQFYILIKEMNSTTICIKEYKSLIENSHL
jgi:hypothetical protein